MRGCGRLKRQWETGQGLHVRGSWCGGRALQRGSGQGTQMAAREARKPKSHCELNFAIIAKFLPEPLSICK